MGGVGGLVYWEEDEVEVVRGKREEGGMKVEKDFREIRMEHWRGTSAHDCITGDAE